MTVEEAIRMIERIKDRINWEVVDSQKKMDALNMAIKALEQEPCEDCISRQAVDELSEALVHTTINKADFVCNFWERLQKLPPVTPKEKTGKWIYTGDYITDGMLKCSSCGYEHDVADRFLYCPNCGARMVEPQESEDKK